MMPDVVQLDAGRITGIGDWPAGHTEGRPKVT